MRNIKEKNRPRLIVPSLVLFMIFLPGFPKHSLADTPKHIVKDPISSSFLMIKGETMTDVDPVKNPGRLYVKGNGNVQSGATIILRVTGIAPGARVYWSFHYRPESSNPNKTILTQTFSPRPPYSFFKVDNSSISDKHGVAQVAFTATTFAGDRIQFGAGLKTAADMNRRFRLATLKSKTFQVWKRLYVEQPMVLKNVRFPQETWDHIKKNLEELNIELTGVFKPGVLDPTHPKCRELFSGKENDLRYGPLGNWDFGIRLEHINILFSDKNPATVNIVVLGALSPNHDLIKNMKQAAARPPQPVKYDYRYKRKDLNPTEFFSYGTAMAIIGYSPSVFVWSDYWWMFSQRVKVPHAKTLARVLLHELGHHLLKNAGHSGESILDNYGHIKDHLAYERTIMNGCQLSVIKDGKGWDFSGISVSKERRFIRKPVWHHRVKRLIRQYYIPLTQ